MDNLIPRILDQAIAIQQIPAPTFHEIERAEYVRACFVEAGLADVQIDAVGNVLARLPAQPSSHTAGYPPLIVSAHLDTVFPLSVDLRCEREPERILAPGIGDNSLGVAGLLGLAWALKEQSLQLPGDLWLVANICEEGLGDLRGIRAVIDRFGAGALAYIVIEGLALGQVYHRGLGVQRYRITVRTSGGHSWIDYGQPSAIHELTALSTQLASLELPRNPRTTLNIGIISGGSSVNTIAAEAMLELDLRSESAETLKGLAGQVEQIIRGVEKPNISVQKEVIGQRPSGEISVDHPLVQLAQGCLLEVGIEPRLNIGSTDGNLPLSLGFPAVTIGLTTGGRAHTVHEYMNLPLLEKGMKQLVKLVSKAWDTIEK
jgi:acetylornithine deacetylase/succinyl-diaminopimelate desuccinylase-like protein